MKLSKVILMIALILIFYGSHPSDSEASNNLGESIVPIESGHIENGLI